MKNKYTFLILSFSILISYSFAGNTFSISNIKDIPKYENVSTHETQVSLFIPFISGFLSNITYYFKNDNMHSLIEKQGAFGVTGKKMDVKLVDHTIKK